MTEQLSDCFRQHGVFYNDNIIGWLKATISTVSMKITLDI